MIRVTVELVPHGDEGRAKTLGRAIIHNVSRNGSTSTKGDYRAAVAHESRMATTADILTHPLRRGEVRDYPRLSYNVWRLVIRALRSAFPEEG